MPRPIASLILLTTVLAGGIALAGCQSFTSKPEQTLYQQLGERNGIANIVEDLLYRIVDDDRINFQFKGIDVVQFHQDLTDQLCVLSHGPCTYTGREMHDAHKDMAITDTQFNALVEDLILAMDENNISTGAQNRLLKQLAPLYSAIR